MGYTMRVSLPGYDALTDGTIDHYSVYADSDNVLIKEYARGTLNIGYGSAGSVTHGLGYIPFYIAFGKVSSGRYRLANFWGYGNWLCFVNSNVFYAQNSYGTSGTTLTYYIFYDNM